MRLLFIAAAATMFGCGAAKADDKDAQLAQEMMVAFQCGQYATFAGDQERAKILYDHGVEAGRRFISTVRKGTITTDAMSKSVPMIVIWRLSEGPSMDFNLGRMFESITSDAADDIIKRDANRLVRPEDKWVFDKNLQRTIAQDRYRTANCWAVGPKE
ncbi:hypothetical protein [Bordetella bronchiseptica]|uniref:hypothetical protein n=1 Tax=Bordetella bronchiseptica TaxID=518 RepID=UPI001267982E|nr:hypothetical protein [Bordetella bronchiseptica]